MRIALAVLSVVAGATVGITLSADAGTRNLLTARQQTFESRKLEGWRGYDGASIRTSTAIAYRGEQSMELRAGLAPAGGTTNPYALTIGGRNGGRAVPVRVGASYEGSIFTRSGSGQQRTVRCDLIWFTSDGSLLAASAGTPVTQVPGSWQPVTCAGTAPSTAAWVLIRVGVQGAGSGERHHFDEARLVETGATAASSPSNFAFRANVASTSRFVSASGVAFEPDSGFLGGNLFGGTGADIQGTTDDALYTKHRWGMSGYDVPVPGSGTYTVRLHFSETVHTGGPGRRVFDVSAEGATRVDNLDVFARVGPNAPLVEQFTVDVSDGTLNLRFVAVSDDPMLSGLEVLGSGVTTQAGTPTTAPTTTAAPTTAPPTTAAPTTAPPTTAAPAPAPTSSGVCTGRVSGGVPADRYPGAACTGVVAGSSLAPQGSLRITQAGSTWENLDIAGNVCVAADNVTIRNSRVVGVVAAANQYGHGFCSVTGGAHNLTLVDVEIRPNNATAVAIEGGVYRAGITCIRCNLHRAGAGINGGNYTLVDTYVHDLLGESNCQRYPGDCISHNDGIQVGGAGGNVTVRHSNIEGSYAPESTGGGMSCAICLYSHGSGDFSWGPMDNVLIERSRIQSDHAVFCAYGGDSHEQNPTNIRYLDNQFVRSSSGTCGSGGPITAWRQGGGNQWSNNRFSDGVLIGEPPTSYG